MLVTRLACLVWVLTFAGVASAAPPSLAANAGRIEQRIIELSKFGANPQGGVSRVAFSTADVAGREYIAGLMRQAGLQLRIDAAGNIIGRREGSDPALPVIMTGSHIDSVPGGGNYDGDVGVIGAIEAVQLLQDNATITRHPIEVVVFTDEEGGTVGSRAMTSAVESTALDVMSHSGETIREGLRAVGGDPDRLDDARRQPGELKAFIELHIEQGAILDESDIDIGVVEGIVGIRWWDVILEGVANHAGTTPMDRRQDALVSAAQLINAVNQVALRLDGRHVATVGQIRAEPGAPNVIPGKVVMSLEIRDLDAAQIQRVFDSIQVEAGQIAKSRQIRISFNEIDLALEPAPTDVRLRRLIVEAAVALGLSHKSMPSGAGHDSQEMTRIAPTGMIFVPSAGGISHAPAEFTSPEDMANGVNVLLQTILAIDRGALESQ